MQLDERNRCFSRNHHTVVPSNLFFCSTTTTTTTYYTLFDELIYNDIK